MLNQEIDTTCPCSRRFGSLELTEIGKRRESRRSRDNSNPKDEQIRSHDNFII